MVDDQVSTSNNKDLGSISQFEHEAEAVQSGVWFGKEHFRANADGTIPEFLLLPADKDLNKKFDTLVLYWRRTNPRLINNKLTDSEEAAEKMFNYVFPRACIINWRNFKDRDGSEIPYTKENVLAYMERFPILRRKLMTAAISDATFMKDQIGDLVGE